MQVTISFQTLHLPPPYAYAYTMHLDFDEKGLFVKFDLEYLDRDEMTDEEILNEGYSPEDKFSWKGQLDPVWAGELQALIARAKLQQETEEEINIWIHVDIQNQKSGLVVETDEWEYRLQELIQAIYEKAGHERPLQMKFIDRKRGQSTYYELTGEFATRTCTINKQPISWQQMQTLMGETFSLAFEGEWTAKPEEDGLWIDPDGFSGYQAVHRMAGKRGEPVKKNLLKILRSTG